MPSELEPPPCAIVGLPPPPPPIWVEIESRISTALWSSAAGVPSVIATISFPPPSLVPRTASVGIDGSLVSSPSIDISALMPPSTSKIA